MQKSAWLEHGPFAMWLVRQLRPRSIVELGTHHGYSYFCMCQAVSEEEIATRCYKIDATQGNEQSETCEDNEYNLVKTENEKYASFSTLIRKPFSEALADIEDNSIDLLHVDGRHYYDDVKEDFESWIPKLSDRAVVLFHDTEVYQRDFGVHRYWVEISQKYPSFGFQHGRGLGVLFFGYCRSEGAERILSEISKERKLTLLSEFFASQGFLLSTRYHIQKAESGIDKSRSDLITIEMLSGFNRANQIFAEKDQHETSLYNAIMQKTEGQLHWRYRRYKRMVEYFILKTLADASQLISLRASSEFRRLAKKRVSSHSKSFRPTYLQVLEFWNVQRQALESRYAALSQELASGPLISVVVPVFNPNPEYLSEMIESVRAQRYSNWELCIADDASTKPEVRKVLEQFIDEDPRVHVVFREKYGNIACAKNSALEITHGTYVAFLDHEDLLDPDALMLVADVIVKNPSVKIVYSDEDKIGEDGIRFEPHFKPDYNRELLYGSNYVSHFGIYNTKLIKKIDGFRAGYEGAQDYDLLLRCLEHVDDRHVHHIPNILYSSRATPGNIIVSPEAKSHAIKAGQCALEEHLTNKFGRQIKVKPGLLATSYQPQWGIEKAPLVSIIIPTRDKLSLLKPAVQSLLDKSTYKNFELVIVDNGSVLQETLDWFSSTCAADKRVSVLRDDRSFNYSRLNNSAVAKCNGSIIALVNNDIEVISPHWLEEMVSLSLRPDVGCVGAKLYYPDDTIQHAGVIIGLGRVAGHLYKRYARDSSGYFGRLKIRQEYTAVTAACLVVRREVYEEVGGLNEVNLPVAFNDIDFCLKVRQAGYRNLWTPLAEFYHHESASRGRKVPPEQAARVKSEVDYMKEHWKTDIFQDPAYNPNLTYAREDVGYAWPNWVRQVN